MSQKNERQADESRATCIRPLAAVVAVVAVIGCVGSFAYAAPLSAARDSALATGPVVPPRGATGLTIPVGWPAAKSTLDVYEDFRCPACKQFEDGYRNTINDLVTKGELKVEYHLVTLIDDNMGGSGSLHAANAAACAQDAGRFTAYHDALFQNQPMEMDDAFADKAKLLELAGKLEGLNTPDFMRCVDDGTHNGWVQKSDDVFMAAGFRGTPTVLLNGRNIYEDQLNPLTPDRLRQLVSAAQS